MPQATTLNPFTLRLRKKHAKGFLTLDNLPTGDDFRDVLREFLESLESGAHVDEDSEKGLKVDWKLAVDNTVEGQVKSGEFGISAELENLDTGNIRQRSTADCEYIPLYFRFEFHPGANEAIVVMQRLGNRGAKSVILAALQAFLDEKYAKSATQYSVAINPLITEAAVEEALGGGIRQVRFIKSTIPSDVADDVVLDDNDEIEGDMELRVTARKGTRWRFTQWMREIASGEVPASEYLEVSGVEYEEVKLEVEVNNGTKVVPLEDVRERLRVSINISGDVKYGDDGHPTLDTIKEQVELKLPEFRQALGWVDE